jgi:uncharacterized protein YukE
MAQLVSSGHLEEAAADLREAAERLTAVEQRLAGMAEHLRWRGRGADRFRAGWRHRHATLQRTIEELRSTAHAYASAADEVRDERRDIARIERAYRDLEATGALPLPRPVPPPHGDTRWREFFRQVVGGLA